MANIKKKNDQAKKNKTQKTMRRFCSNQLLVPFLVFPKAPDRLLGGADGCPSLILLLPEVSS